MADSLAICVACGTQFDQEECSPPSACKICDDPRQYVPPTGQAWTSHAKLLQEHKNVWYQDSVDSRLWFIYTEPKFAIGQRCALLKSGKGNMLWDLITLLDQHTIDFINSHGGLDAIVISHPHYYTTHLEWAKAFNCPVYLAAEDAEWYCREADSSKPYRNLVEGATETIFEDVTIIKAGGHFPGSFLLHWENKLFIADTFVTVPSALYHIDRPAGTTSFVFMWSIPNMIPLPPSEIQKLWEAVKDYEFDTTFGAFKGLDVRDKNVKLRVLQSMQIQIKAEGHHDHLLLSETLP